MIRYKPCGCDQHWLLAPNVSETELVLGGFYTIKRRRDGKLFVGNARYPEVWKYVECRCMECPNIQEHLIA